MRHRGREVARAFFDREIPSAFVESHSPQLKSPACRCLTRTFDLGGSDTKDHTQSIRLQAAFAHRPRTALEAPSSPASENPTRQQIDRFIREEIETVPQLEALLLIWRHAPRAWTCEEMMRELYISSPETDRVLVHLLARNLIVRLASAPPPAPAESSPRYALPSNSPEEMRLLTALDRTYRHDLIRISRMIHAAQSPGLRDFSRAFRFKKD